MIARLPAAADESERRHLTIFFSDLSGSTRIAAAMEPEDYADLLQRLRELCERIIPRHGGEIVRIDGDGVLCIFGYPVAYDDAGRRAIEAALDLHDATSALDQSFAPDGTQIRLHTGIHSGIVLVRPGDLVRGRFEMLGDATNVAARLCDHAAADEIVVSEATLGADRSFFVTGPQRRLRLQGRQHDLPVYAVFGRELVESRFAARMRRGVAPFAGRREQLVLLDELLADVSDGNPRVAILVGPAGIGKTRLAGEFLDRAAATGAIVHRGSCEAYLGAQPLQPFTQILQSLRDGETDPGSAPDALATTLLGLIAARQASPAILAIDDWQWADDASSRLLQSILPQLTGRVLVLLATRPDDPVPAEIDGATVIPVPPLAGVEAESAIEGLLAEHEPFLVERIRDQAGGSPLYIEELCHALRDDKTATLSGDRSAWLDTMIQARFARLPRDQAELVSTAAVIGHIIPIWLFEQITGVGANDPAVRRLMHEDFIYEGETADTLRFKHIITRDAVYRIVGLKQRQALHGRTAEALETRSRTSDRPLPLDTLAYHYSACGNVEQALHYSVRAGDAAMALPALDRAQAHYREALSLLVKLRPTAERAQLTSRIIHKFGLASVVDPSPEQLRVLEAAERSSEATQNAPGLVSARYWLGALLYGVGRARDSVVKLEQALAQAESLGLAPLIDQLRANLGQSYFAHCRYDDAKIRLDTAISGLYARQSSNVATGLAYAIGSRALLNADQGRFEDAYRDFALIEDVLDGARPAMFGSILNKRSVVALWQGQYGEAIAQAEAGIAHGTQTRSRYYTMMSRALLAYASWLTDRDSRHIDSLVQVATWFHAGAGQHRTSLCYSWLADAMSQNGEVAGARSWASAALRRARSGDRLGEALACRAMARVAASGAGHRPVRHYLQRAYRSADLRGSVRETAETRLCEAQISLLLGDMGHALDLATLAKTDFTAMAMDEHVKSVTAVLTAPSSR